MTADEAIKKLIEAEEEEGYFSDELPEEFAFAVFDNGRGTESQQLKQENQKLKVKLAAISALLGRECDT